MDSIQKILECIDDECQALKNLGLSRGKPIQNDGKYWRIYWRCPDTQKSKSRAIAPSEVSKYQAAHQRYRQYTWLRSRQEDMLKRMPKVGA